MALAVEVQLRRLADRRISAGRALGHDKSKLARRQNAEAHYQAARPYIAKADAYHPRFGRKALVEVARRMVDRDPIGKVSEPRERQRMREAIKASITVTRVRIYRDEKRATRRGDNLPIAAGA
jgi:hypothetical protein